MKTRHAIFCDVNFYNVGVVTRSRSMVTLTLQSLSRLPENDETRCALTGDKLV
jgi:hypothetical protein